MARQVQQPIYFSDAHCLRTGHYFENLVAGLDLSLLQHTEIEARPAVGNQERGHARFVHAYADAIASHSGLGDLEQGRANPVSVADADFRIGQTVNCKVLSELSGNEICATD